MEGNPHFLVFGKREGEQPRFNICLNSTQKTRRYDFFLNCHNSPAIGHGDKPYELGIPHLEFYNPPKRLGCISKIEDFRYDRVEAQKRPEAPILAYFENL